MNYIPFKRNEPKRYSDQCNKILNNNNNNIYKEKRKIITDISPFNLDKHIKFNNLNSKCYNESEIYAINNQINFSKEKSDKIRNRSLNNDNKYSLARNLFKEHSEFKKGINEKDQEIYGDKNSPFRDGSTNPKFGRISLNSYYN